MKKFSLKSLYKIIEKRVESKNINSYSYKLYKNPKLLKKKILEEANELIRTKNRKQVVWEASDLLYFIIVFLVKRGVKLNKIEKKLMERNKNKEKLQYSKKKEEKMKNKMKFDKINILFVCKYNVFRSRVAEFYFNKINKNKNVRAKSAGIIAGGVMGEKQRATVGKKGLILEGKSKGLNTKILNWQNITIIVADDVPPIIFNKNKKYGKKTIVWKINDTKVKEGKDIPAIMRRIKKKVEELNKSIEKGELKW